MGVNQLAAWIKACVGLKEDLMTMDFHLDFAAMFFFFVSLNAHAFFSTVETETKHARS